MSPPRPTTRAFTLLELLIVVGLVAALAVVIVASLGPSRGSALQASQGTMANLLVAARTKATSANRSARLLVNFNPNSPEQPSRYLRYLVLQVQQPDLTWRTVADAFLPEGIYVVPGVAPLPAGLLPEGGTWTRPSDGMVLRSSAIRTTVTETVGGAGAENWLAWTVTASGTTSNSNGDIVLAVGARKAPGSFATGEPPVTFLDQEQVRGLIVSTYGVAALVSDRTGF